VKLVMLSHCQSIGDTDLILSWGWTFRLRRLLLWTIGWSALVWWASTGLLAGVFGARSVGRFTCLVRPSVGFVEAAAFKGYSHVAEHLLHLAAAVLLRAHSYRIIFERLT